MHLNRSGFLIEPFTSRSAFQIQFRPVVTKCCCHLTALLCPVWIAGFSPGAGGQVPELHKPPELTLTGRLCRGVKEWISPADELTLNLYALWCFVSSKRFTNVSQSSGGVVICTGRWEKQADNEAGSEYACCWPPTLRPGLSFAPFGVTDGHTRVGFKLLFFYG